MRENASRSPSSTCRLTAARLIVSMCCALFAAGTVANAATDFSDYSVFASASSTTVSTIKIGAVTDSETAITANTTATGDDTTGSDDEDGVTVPSSISVVSGTTGSLTVNVTNTSGATTYLNAWIDFNRNGVLTDTGEQIATNTVIATGTSNSNKTVSFTVPATAVTGTAGVRVRLTSTSSPGSTGLSGNGEVEDYITTLVCPTLALSPSTLASANTGNAYSQTLSTSGGTSPYTYSITSGSLPSGLSLNTSTGVISGTPTSVNSATFTIKSTDAKACNTSVSYTVAPTCPNLLLTLPTPTAAVGTAYSQTFTVANDTGPYTFSVASGSLPTWATLNTSTGVLSGTPTNTTSYTFTVKCTDPAGCNTTSTSYTIMPTNYAAVTVGPASLSGATVGTGYSQTITATQPVGFSVQQAFSSTELDTLADADALLSGTNRASNWTGYSPTINFSNGTSSHYTDTMFPGGDGDDFAVRATATITIPTAGAWTFAFNSDDGGRLKVDGTAVITDDALHSPADRFGTVTLSAGTHTLDLVFFERGGGAVIELFAAAGTLSAFSSSFQLIGSASGLAVVQTQPAYTFALKTGTLPAWASLNASTGVLSGTPNSTTSSTFTIQATDGNGFYGVSPSYTITPANNYDYSDYSGFGNAASTMNSSLRIGSTVDSESLATTNATATGDDITGTDDEDGVTVPASIMLGNASTITVNVSNTSGATAYLNAWIDYNQNGVLTDSGEQIATNTVIATGTSNSNKVINFTVPLGATVGTTGVRVRLTSTSSPGSTGTSGNGEVEDYTVTLAPSLGIGNMIWNDANENGLFDAGESGIDNVLVELWSPGADNAIGGTGSNADTKVSSVNSAGGGLYNFSGLSAGYYYVKVPTPPLSRTSLVVDTTDNGQDGDNNASQPGGSSTSAYSPVIQLVVGTEPGSTGTGNIDNTVDFGFASNIGSPFVCDNRFWIIQSAETSAGSGDYVTTLYYVGDGPSLVPAFIFDGYRLNGMAAYGGYLYCVDQQGNHLYRINSQGVLVDMGAIPGLPSPGTTGQWSGATALTNGRMILNLFTFSPATTQLYTIDLTSASLIGSGVTVTNAGTGTTYAGNFGDIVWDPLTNKVYGYSTVDTSWLGLFEINLTTGVGTRVSSAVPGAWGSLIIDANGLTYGFGSAGATGNQDTLYVFNRTSGVLNGSITAVGSGPSVSGSDGAACPGAPPSMKMGNLVWNDVNNNGLKDSGESGIDGVTLQLFLGGQNPLTAAPAATTTTSGGGFYAFSNLSPGQYFIYMPTPPAAYPLSSTTTVTTDNNVDNDDNGIQTAQGQPVQSPLIGLAGGTESITDGDTDSNTNLTIDFGFLACATTTVSPTTPAAMTFGTAYTQTFTATGGISPYTWSVSSGTLPAGLSLNSSTGVVSGTPTSGATASFTLTATGTGGCTGSRAYSVTPTCTTVSVTTSTLPDAFVGTAYNQTLAASGGTTPYTWSVSSGTLPAGLSLSSAGVISGTATAANGAGVNVTFTAMDAKSCVASKTLLVQTCPVVTVSPGTLPVPTVGTAYSQTISASGGTGTTVLAVASGTLPAGLSFNTSTGVLSGTPTSTTSATFVISGTDANGCIGTRSYTVAAVCPTVTVSPSTLPDAVIGTAYSQTLSATGGTASYTWAVSSGTLPAGLSLNTTSGVLSGTPTTSNGTGVSLTFRATDAYGCQGTMTTTLQVCPVLAMSPATLTSAVQGSAYSQALSTTGGTASYSYALSSGTLPAGLALSGTGVISGTPTASNGTGTSITVRVTDANGCQATFTRNIQVCPVITLTPSTLAAGTVGTAYSQTISASGGATSYVFAVSTGTLPAGLSLNGSTGVISGTPTTPTAASFTISATDANLCTGSISYTVTPAPNTDFGDFSSFASASNTSNGTLKLGSLIDMEVTGTTNASATGDDITGSDDEDGVTVPSSITAGAAVTIPVVVTNSGGTTAYLNAWIDFNNNGSLADSGEQIAADLPVAAGSSASTINVSFNVPTGASLGTSRGVRVRLTGASSPGPTGTGGVGEVEDYIVSIVAPTVDFGDYNGFGSAASTMNSTLKLGALTDVEGQAQANATATGDDTTGSDDEDGVTVPATITQGVASSLTVNVTNTSGASAYLNAWIDYNGNGSLSDSGEQIATNTVIATGTSNSNKTISFTVPATVKVGTTGVRVRLTSTSSPGSTGTIGNGEVEDYVTNIAATSDFGDYASFGSASSKSNNTLKLGLLVDAEGSSVLNATATGDDLDGSADEDGVTVPVSIAQGAAGSMTVKVTNTSGSTGYLNAWIDFNRNGVLTDSGEQVAVNTSITTGTSNGSQVINFTAPVAASLGTAGVRVRFTSTSSPGSTGLSGNGEVEDYVTNIVVPTTDFGDYNGFADAFSTANSDLVLGTLVDAEGSATKNAAATGDDTTGSDDEDSVVFPSMTAGQPGSVSVIVTNTTGAPAYLNAWIDFNNNGSLLDAGEQIASDILIDDGTSGESQVVNFTVPTNAVTAATSLGTRLRLTSVASPGPTGGAGIGEVEDHTIVILAPLTDFGDFSGAPDVSNTASTNLRLGALVDTEYSSTRNATATGDDVVGSDDEDGVTLPSLMAGAPATIPVVVTNNTLSAAYLNAWIDYNNNGVFTDAGEQIASNVSLLIATTNVTQNINITVPAAAQTGTNLGARFRVSNDISPGSTGSGGVGEVEDYVVNIAPATTDFGDFSSFASASSIQVSTIKLGPLTDTEYVQTTNATATGDDITGQADEDAVTFPTLTAGAPTTIPVLVTNTSGATVYLNAWIDYNNNGVLTDAGEQIATNVSIATGSSNVTQNLNVTIPATALTGVSLGTRFRLTSVSSPGSTGAAGNGEVEDYIVSISAPTTDYGDFSGFADASQGTNPSLHIGPLIDAEYASTRNATATGDDITGTDDEDGVTVPSMIAGQTVTIPVSITNTTGAIGYLNAWVDFNNNGLLTDSGEQIATNLTIATGTTNGVTNLSVAVPANAVTGTNIGLRFRLSAPSGLGPTGANGLAGEVEDYVVNLSAPTTDFGDFSGFGSASSTQISTMKIGSLTDTEYVQTTNASATGDDSTGVDDEDGVTLPTLTAGAPATIPVTVTNTSGATAFLNAWIDYNNNGVLTDAGEQIASNTVIANGTNNVVQNLNITVPATATVGTTLGVRLRLTSTSTPGSTGQSGNGEVEDYIVNIASPTTDFGDFSGFASASNAAGTGLRMGALVDTEFSATTNATATGDDITGQADEDGVVLPTMTAGQTLTIPVVVTNTTGSGAFLNAWIDFNNNGVPTDAGEQIITNLSVASGSNGATLNPSITVPAGAVTGTSLGVRFRLTAVSSPGVSGALASLGEVEDYTVNIALPTTDFGDNASLANASSIANSNLRLGALTDVEYVATNNLTATGDDITGQADEDGVTLPTLTAGAPATIPVIVTNNTGAAAFLNVWIDYNNNSVLTDAGEQIATNLSIPTGTTSSTQNLSITVPATAQTGNNLAVRVRLTSVSSPGSSGAAGSGEVEDYVVNIATPLLDYGDWSGIADAASSATNALRLGALVDTEYVSTRNIGATGDDITAVDDEDGVTLPSMTAGAPATIPVIVTNNTGAAAFLNVWIDYNNNGVLTDAGEQIATNVAIASGITNGTQNVSITIPSTAVTGSNVGLRVRLTDVASPGVTGTTGNGEVEDYVTSIAVPTTDFGDWNGAADASSIASSNLRMGALADTEYVSTVNGTATGDDITGSDDEDGVTLGSQTPGTAGSATVVVTNNSGAAGYLNAWIDFNNNGSFADAGEQIATNTSIATGTNGVTQTVNFIVPVGAVPGQRGARFRLTSTQTPTSVGASGMGEVEDYLVTITCLPIGVTPATLATPTVGTAYSQSVASTGGMAPYTFSIGSGSLPAGLTLSSAGVISGTATSSNAVTFTVVATDAYGCSGATSYTVTPVCPAVTVNPTTLPSGLAGTAYSQTLTASGGTAGYTFAVSSGTLPTGLTLNASTGVLSGTPTTSNASGVSLTFRATDANGCSGTRTINLIICPVITLTPATLPTPSVGTAYSQAITATGSTAAYTYTVAGGALPAWATLSTAGVLSGTPTTTTSATFTVKATDANGCTGTLSYTVAPVCPTITITPAALTQGTVGTAYSQTMSASGGTAPYSAWTLTGGTLPAGLSLNASTGVISGTPTATVSPATTITLRVNDVNGCQGTRSVTLQICPVITLSPATLPAPVVGTAYSQSLSASNGTSPYTFTLASGTLPAWATLSTAGVLSGLPTTTTSATFTVKATDANGCAVTLSYTLTPVCPTISLAPTVTAQGIVGSAYSQTLTPSGGTAPYSAFTVTSGTLPAGLTLNASTGVISGTPTTINGTGVSVSIRVTDTYGCQGTQAITVQVCPVITLAPTTPATPTVSTAYSQNFTASGSSGSYTFTVASGALPTWATLSTSGTLSGMPDSPNSATFTIKATDANGCSGTQSYTITPVCPTLTITPTTAVAATVGSIYSQTLSGNGGTGPYASWTVTSGTLPAGLSLSSAGVISGTPTASNGAGVSFTVRTTDARGCQATAVISLKVCPVVSVSPSTLAASTAGSSYSQTLTASGGAGSYVYAVASGSLPTGLTLNASSGVISGTPTSTSTANFTISATDANGCAGTRGYTLTPACQTITVGPATLANGTVNSAYSQTVTSTSGIGTVTFAVSSGSLPAGLSLNSNSGVISGTPTSVLAATFTVRATDANGCTGSTSYTVTPVCPTITVTPATLATGNVGVAYSQTLSGVGGIAPYSSWTVTSGTLPAGLVLNPSSGVISGTPTTSNGTGVSVTIRATDANGCQGSSALSVKICPVITQSPATLPAPVVGTAYTQTLTASGGVSAYTFTLVSGALPTGMTLSSSGTISGTTPSAASATFTVKATAADGCVGTASYTLSPVCPTLAISPNGTLSPAYLGAAYTQALTASGGTSAYTFALQSGDLPGGVLLASNGVLSGTPNAKGIFPVTVRVTDANSCSQSFNITLQVHTLSIGNLVFEDSNNNGLRDSSEPAVAGATVQLFNPGSDNAIGGSAGAADVQIGSSLTTDSTGAYLFSSLPAGKYYIKVTPPADYLFTGGTADTSDDDIDNNNDGAQPGGSGTPLFSPIVTLSGGAESTADGDSDPDTNLTVDFGLWASVGVGNMIFLDINGDGHRNEGESIGNIYVELYAQGATPGVDSPVSAGTSGCSCKGRYFLDSLNPGTYFLYIPPSQFTSGGLLEGLLPMSNVVAGDDDSGQDLIYNSNPAVNGASTSIFTLRPGFCPTGSAESGVEGTIDDSMDARVDLTRDLGVVAPAGTGFAASEAIRRYIVTGGFTASVLPGATTFALWSQNSNIGKATDDPDEDGQANLMEYALGTDPGNPLQASRFTLTQNATGNLVALLTLPTGTHDDLSISLETLTDLSKAGTASAWKKLTMAATTTLNADGTLTRAYANLEKLLVFSGLDTGFVRLHVDLDANRDGVPEATATSPIQGWGRQSFATGSRTFSMPLVKSSFFTGRAVSASANEIMLPAILTLPAGSLYLEVLDGTLAGQRFDIDSAASSGNTVVLQNTTQSYAGLVNAHIAIRLHHTLAELLPPAAFGSDDRVLFFDPASSSYTTLTHAGDTWLSGVLSMSARPVAAHEAALVQIRGSGTTLIYTGEVRQTGYVTALVAGTQLIAPGWPVASPAPVVTGLTSGITPESADRLRLWDGDSTPSASSYTGYYLDGSTTPPAWLPQTAPAAAATVQPFHGYFLIRTAPLQMKQSAPW